MAIIEFSQVCKTFGRRGHERAALADVSFELAEGAFGLLVGPSGAGKTTLLKLILALERPDEGVVRVAGRDIQRLRRTSIPYLRRNVGVVFQDFKLLPAATPLDNVRLALEVLGLPGPTVRARAAEALQQVELDPRSNVAVQSLSGGEQQRVAVARALAAEPAMLLADEPTGNLDPRLSRDMLDLLASICRQGTTILLATHDPLVVEHAQATAFLRLVNGRLEPPPRRSDRVGHRSGTATSSVEAVA